MKWFKHMTNLAEDTRIRRVLRKYGPEGYAVYNYILERVARRLETESPLPDLEENAEDIALHLYMDTARVQEIVEFCLSQGLFSQDEVTGRVLCWKMYKFLETSQTGNPRFRTMIQHYKESNHDSVMTQSRLVSLEENRTEEKRREEEEARPSAASATRYENLCRKYGNGVVDDYVERVKDWAAAKGKKYRDYVAAAHNWLKRDGVQPVPGYAVKPVPTAPVKCPHCGGRVKSTHDEAMCAECFASWKLSGGEWVAA